MNNYEDAVHAENLTVKFGNFKAVDDISFVVRKGEVFGFLGANGAGKTTTIRVLCGLLIPSFGDVKVAGLDVAKATNQVKSKVGYMSQRFTLYDDLTVMENLAFAAALRKLEKEYSQARIRHLFEFIGFDWDKNTFVADLPAGIKQQVALVAATLHDPEIIFLDEPTAGVTPAFREKFWELIRELSNKGKTVFVTTHYMDEAEHCGRIALMRSGQIIALDSPGNLKKSTFKNQIYELDFGKSVPDIFDKLKSQSFIEYLEIYGRNYHVAVKSEDEWKKYVDKEKLKFVAKKIKPSLEDVFIRLVEGEDR